MRICTQHLPPGGNDPVLRNPLQKSLAYQKLPIMLARPPANTSRCRARLDWAA